MFTTEESRIEYFKDAGEGNVIVALEAYADHLQEIVKGLDNIENVALLGASNQRVVNSMQDLLTDLGGKPKLWVVDIDEMALQNIDRNTVGDIETTYIQGNALRLPFPNGSLDYVHLDFLGPFIAVADQESLLKEIKRVLRSSGIATSFVTTISTEYDRGVGARGTLSCYRLGQKNYPFRTYDNQGVPEVDVTSEFIVALAKSENVVVETKKIDRKIGKTETFVGWGNDMGYSSSDIDEFERRGIYNARTGCIFETTSVDITLVMYSKP